MTEEARIYNGEKMVSSISGAGKTGQLCKRMKLEDSLVVQMVKNPPAVQEIWVQPLDQEDPLGKEMANHSNILENSIYW